MADRHSPGYQQEYQKNNYDRITFLVPKGRKQTLKDLSLKTGESVGSLIITALESTYGIDLSND